MRKLAIRLTPLLILALIGGTLGCAEGEDTTPTPTATATATPIETATVTPTPIVSPIPAPQLRVHFIDVGQGDAILLDLEETEVLIDGGGRSSGVVEYLRDYVDGPLEGMIATHPGADHIGGLIDVLAAFEVDAIWRNGQDYYMQAYRDFTSAVNSEGAGVKWARRGDVITVGDLTFEVLHPVEPVFDDINNGSIVLALSYGQIDFLFAGDAEREAEADMLVQSIVQMPDVDIFKVGRHASRTASSLDFLRVIRPEIAIYMAGEGNTYGHPHRETLSRLEDIGAEVYGTDVDGTITVVTDGEEYIVYSSPN
ncbi:MAG: ComEC/Rec2 family competence protein [Dehalococcoidia bacterium]